MLEARPARISAPRSLAIRRSCFGKRGRRSRCLPCDGVRLFSAACSFQFPSGGIGARGRQQSPEGRGSEVEEPLGPQGSFSLSVARYVGGEDASWPHRARSLASRLCRRPARGRGKRSAMPASSAKGEKVRAFLRTRLGTCPDVAAAFCAILFFFGWGCAGRPRTTQSRGARHPSPAPEQGCPRSCPCANTVQVRRARSAG